ncbi:FolC bifunctional protein [Backusella circina FSU 941]|nr:FolC bifunctional protein [Backusella circina FSU 941]
MNFGLERIHNLLEVLGRPDERMCIVHVAGTNGKGSVCAYISTVLFNCGYTVGRFNSPHLIEPRDSIIVNNQAVTQQVYDDALSHVAHLNKTLAIGASSFECLVGASFYIFDNAKLDFVVLEVGLGGLLDATNAIRHPKMTVITAIGLDHANILGHTVEEIATAKAGIMKPDCPVVIMPQDKPSVLDTLVRHAEKTKSPYRLVTSSEFIEPGLCKLDIDENKQYTYPIQLCGDYQRMNSATAVTALDWLNDLGVIKLTPDILAKGMGQTRWPGRLDWVKVDETPKLAKYGLNRLLVDGAHNPPASLALRAYVDSLETKRVIWIIGTTAGKDISEMMQQLLHAEDVVFAVPFSQPDGMSWISCTDPNEITQHIDTQIQAVPCKNLEEALVKAGTVCGEDEVTVLCGSLYLVADLYRTVG